MLTVHLWTLPPHVAAFGKHGGTNDFRGHPGIRPSRTHLGGSVPFPSQAEISDLQDLVAQVSILHLLEDQYWTRKGIQKKTRESAFITGNHTIQSPPAILWASPADSMVWLPWVEGGATILKLLRCAHSGARYTAGIIFNPHNHLMR